MERGVYGKIIRYSRSTINVYFLLSHEWWVPSREHVFMVFWEYTIISRVYVVLDQYPLNGRIQYLITPI